MANNINTMQIWCYINYHWNNTKIKSIQSKLFQCLFYTNKALNLGHLVKVLWKHLNSTNTKGSPLCDALWFILPNLMPLHQNTHNNLINHAHFLANPTRVDPPSPTTYKIVFGRAIPWRDFKTIPYPVKHLEALPRRVFVLWL
jgi:hypothetical protein